MAERDDTTPGADKPAGVADKPLGVADAPAGNWVDRHAPAPVRPYLHLARWDRPIGTWLLLWPCWWAIALAMPVESRYLPDLYLMALFAVGAVAMRGAGCTYNDIVDRGFDAQVARTRSRPIPSGAVSVRAAWAFLVLQCLAGLAVLMSLNPFTIVLGIASLAPIAIYPFMKRWTYWPQLMLGLTFNWGALMGWAAVTGTLAPPAALLYLGCVFWTLGYDTIYAHQDKEDDLLLGLKSTALRLGTATKWWLYGFYTVALAAFAGAGALAEIGWVYYIGLGFGAWHLYRQVYATNLDTPSECLAAFRSNRDFGVIVFGALLAGTLGSSL